MFMNYRRRLATVGFIAILLTASFAFAQTRVASVGQGGLRISLDSQVMPEYPAASIAQAREGVVVSLVTGAPGDRITQVDVLQSPDEHIAAAVRTAVMQWTFRAPRPGVNPSRYEIRDKLTLYFQIRNGKGVVLYPEQMPGNEDVFEAWFKPAGRAGAGGPMIVRRDTTGIEEIDEDALRQLLNDRSTVLLDIRDREPFAASAHPRAINMPFDEVSVRSGAELPRTAQIVIDCSQEDTSKCRFNATELGERGFKKVAIFIP